jgi:hypothetical protein
MVSNEVFLTIDFKNLHIVKEHIAKIEEENARLHQCEEALIGMVEQYLREGELDEPAAYYSHMFMSAGECAFEYLVKAGRAKWCENGFDITLIYPEAS